MQCESVRDRLLHRPDSGADDDARRHLADCTPCRRFAERLTATRRVLAGDADRPPVRPDAGFAARVLERLPERRPTDLLGWAALRLLPPAFASALALAVWCVWATPTPSGVWEAGSAAVESVSPETDLMAWVLDAELPGDAEGVAVGADTPESEPTTP